MSRWPFAIARLVLLSLAVSSLHSLPAYAEDVKLRESAVALIERANQVSLPGTVANFEQVVTFRVHYPDGSTKEGTYSRIGAAKGMASSYREERTFGDYHAITVRSDNRLSSTGTWAEPPELREVREQLPVHLGRFDHEDVILSINDDSVKGRPAKCIEFNTHFGATLQHNELCTDVEHGYLVRWKVGNEYIENSEYFQVGNLWEPAHMQRSIHGKLRLELTQSVKVIEGEVDPNIFTPPTGRWNKTFECQNMRRPVVLSTPQPAPGDKTTKITDVLVTGMIRETGKTEALKVQSSSGRPDLDAEALTTVAAWTFQPMMCSSHPVTTEADFVVHFQGR
jgi:TonB family protein